MKKRITLFFKIYVWWINILCFMHNYITHYWEERVEEKRKERREFAATRGHLASLYSRRDLED
jgi:hypothetical protein